MNITNVNFKWNLDFKMKAQTHIFGQVFVVNEDLSLKTPTGVISKEEMQEISKEYRGVNRIHKPMALLFWTDVKNGKTENWKS